MSTYRHNTQTPQHYQQPQSQSRTPNHPATTAAEMAPEVFDSPTTMLPQNQVIVGYQAPPGEVDPMETYGIDEPPVFYTANPAPIPQENVENYHGYSVRVLPPDGIPGLRCFLVRVFRNGVLVTDPNPPIRVYDLFGERANEPLWIISGESTWTVSPYHSYEVVYRKGVQGQEKTICRFGVQLTSHYSRG